MRFNARKLSTRRRHLPTALALAAALPALAALAGASPAAAQEYPDVDVYHSPDDDGVDPRPAFSPGCKDVAGGSGPTGSVLVFGDYVSSAASLESDLVVLGYSVTRLQTLPADLSPYAVIWHVSATAALTAEEQTALAGFLAAGGGVHLTGERPCCEPLNDSLQALVNSVVVGGGITVGDQGDIGPPYPFNSTAVGGIATSPNSLEEWSPASPGGLGSSGLDPDNILVTGGGSTPVGAVWDSADLVGGAGRLTLLMDVNWFTQSGPLPVIENLQSFLSSGSGSALDCAIKGTADEQLDLWIDGGSSEADSEGTTCMMGPDGDTGNRLCGADILLEITGAGVFTHFQPVIATLIQYPECEPDGGSGFCSLPAGTKKIRMNFRRGVGTPPAGPRKVASLLVDSRGSTEASPTTVWLKGVAAASANLQVRPIAAGGPEKIAEGPMPMPEPGEALMLATGIFALAGLYRLRRGRS